MSAEKRIKRESKSRNANGNREEKGKKRARSKGMWYNEGGQKWGFIGETLENGGRKPCITGMIKSSYPWMSFLCPLVGGS